MKNSSILVIIPAHNEERALPGVVAEVREKAPFADLIVIDDYSTDGTRLWCHENGVPVVSLMFNLGIGGAVQTGYRYAVRHGYEIAIQVDGDGQHPAEQIEALLAPLRNGEADVVIGSRFLASREYSSTLPRFVGITLFSFITSLIIGRRITDVTSGFRAANAAALDFFAHNYPDDFPDAETIILLSFAGLRVKEVPVRMRSRSSGVSVFDFRKSFVYFFKTSISIVAALLASGPRKRKSA